MSIVVIIYLVALTIGAAIIPSQYDKE